MTTPEHIIEEVEVIIMPCSHAVPRPRPYTRTTVTCPVDKRVFIVESDAGGHAWSAQEVSTK